MSESPMLTPEALKRAGDFVSTSPVKAVYSDADRIASVAVRAFLAAQDREALTRIVGSAIKGYADEHKSRLAYNVIARRVIDSLLGGPDE